MANPKMILKIAIGKMDKSNDENEPEEKTEGAIVELVERVFNTRSLVHFEHLTTNSFAAHSALGELYDAIVDEVDALAECYVGEFGPLSKLEIDCATMPPDIIAYIKEEFDWIKTNRSKISNGSTVIENMLDGLSSQYTRALYKLKQLK